MVRSLALSHLDYCNSILAGLPKKSIKLMQCIQNIGAKMILNKKKTRDSATECIKELYWLPIQQRIDFKKLVPVFKSLNKQTPKYLQELIIKKEQRKEGLRLSTKCNLLKVPTTKQVEPSVHTDQPNGMNCQTIYVHVPALKPLKNY